MDAKTIVRLYHDRMFKITTHNGTFYSILYVSSYLDDGFACGWDIYDNFFEIEPFNGNIILKPILKHVCDMPKEDKVQFRKMTKTIINEHDKKAVWIADTPQSLLWCIENGYDLFDLIEKELAIDITEL